MKIAFGPKQPVTTDDAVRRLRRDIRLNQLVEDAYLDVDPRAAAKRFSSSAAFAEIAMHIGPSCIRGATVLDVGAGRGIASWAYLSAGASSVISLEPDPSEVVGRGAIAAMCEMVRVLSSEGRLHVARLDRLDTATCREAAVAPSVDARCVVGSGVAAVGSSGAVSGRASGSSPSMSFPCSVGRALPGSGRAGLHRPGRRGRPVVRLRTDGPAAGPVVAGGPDDELRGHSRPQGHRGDHAADHHRRGAGLAPRIATALLDYRYIENWSLRLDSKIMLRMLTQAVRAAGR